jgi:Cu-processing system permease protein
MNKIFKYVLLDILRNKIILGYAALLLAITVTVLNLEDNSAKAVLSLLNIVLIVLPLVSIIFSTIYYYNSVEFIELLVCQPLKRVRILLSLYAGLAFSLLIAFWAGAGIPLLICDHSAASCLLLLVGSVLTLVFSALAVMGSVLTRDKARGIGVAILLWFYFSVLYDGLVLFLLFQFSDYPLEKPSIALVSLNPIDLSRIVILLQTDNSAMMGYTGAVFRSVFGGGNGTFLAVLILLLWIALPLWATIRRFNRKDL